MSLAPGTRLGPYEVVSAIGAGGMGEVYRARDTRLDRTVAIKVLPGHVAGDPTARERFEREARSIAALNHPHICTLHDIGQHDRTAFLVLEYLEGETLAERLTRGALPIDQALQYAIQIADALDKAHRAGIVHRDLKPGNVMLTKAGTKLLDFGLAKMQAGLKAGATPGGEAGFAPTAVAQTFRSASQATSPAREMPLTQQGTILGTFHYMAPEQIEGREADARTDIFAFGVLLHEMLTGQKAFDGKTLASVMAAILERHPRPIGDVQPLASAQFDHVVGRCLAKDPDDRWQTMRDVLAELKWVAASPSRDGRLVVQPRRARWGLWVWVASAAVAAAVVGLAAIALQHWREHDTPGEVVRFRVDVPSIEGGTSPIAVSPDGRRIAFVARGSSGNRSLWVHSLDSLEPKELAIAAFPGHLFWSPDGRFIGYDAEGELRRLDPASGIAQTICKMAGRIVGGSWGTQDTILFALEGRLMRVGASGGTPALALEPDSARGQEFSRPSFLPDGRRFLFLSAVSDRPAPEVCVGSLDSRAHTCLGVTATIAGYAPGEYLVYGRDRALFAASFDSTAVKIAGDPIVLVNDLFAIGASRTIAARWAADFSASGTLAYFASEAQREAEFVWFDRSGKRLGGVGGATGSDAFDLSNDDKYLVVSRRGLQAGVWVVELARGAAQQVVPAERSPGDVVWAPDGQRFVYNHFIGGRIVEQQAFGRGERVVLEGSAAGFVEDWSHDGRFLAIGTIGVVKRQALRVPVDGGKPEVFAESTSGLIDEYQFSPDGHLIAYNSNESGRHEIYLAPLPPSGERWQVSIGGGMQSRWSGDGSELFFLAPDGTLMVAAVRRAAAGRPDVGVPQPLFKTPLTPTFNVDQYAVSRDGRRVLLKVPSASGERSTLMIVLNWPSLLRKD